MQSTRYKLMATDADNLPKPDKITVALLCDLFLQHSKLHHKPDTYENYRHFLQAFCDSYRSLLASEMKPFHVSRWLDKHTSWKGGRRHGIIAVRRAFSWADEEGILSPNPLRTLKAGRAAKRTRVLTAEEQAEILNTVRDKQFKTFLRAMLATGCRPSEVARVTAANVNLELGVWVFDQHKTEKQTKKSRVIYLTPEMVELSRELMQKQPEGPLFRGPRRNSPYSRNAIRTRFRRLRAKLPHLKYFVCYNVRHTFATQALVNGVGVAQVAELLGHTSTEMVSSRYGHLAEEMSHMRDAAKKATGG
jgi:integrase